MADPQETARRIIPTIPHKLRVAIIGIAFVVAVVVAVAGPSMGLSVETSEAAGGLLLVLVPALADAVSVELRRRRTDVPAIRDDRQVDDDEPQA